MRTPLAYGHCKRRTGGVFLCYKKTAFGLWRCFIHLV